MAAKSITFDRLTNLAIIIAAAVLVATQVKLWRVHGNEEAATPRRTEYAVGEVIPGWTAVAKPSSANTLLVVVNSACRFCTESMPFYARLNAASAARHANLIVASRETVDETRDYLKRHGIEQIRTMTLPPDFAPKLVVTPTVMLVDAGGTVRRLWTGRLPTTGENDVLSVLKAVN